MVFYFIVFLAQIEDSMVRRNNQNTTTTGEPMQPEGKSINNAHMRSNLPSDHTITLSHNKTIYLTPPKLNQICSYDSHHSPEDVIGSTLWLLKANFHFILHMGLTNMDMTRVKFYLNKEEDFVSNQTSLYNIELPKTLGRDLLHTTPICCILAWESWANVIRVPTNPSLVW